jgi:hypothetical protein
VNPSGGLPSTLAPQRTIVCDIDTAIGGPKGDFRVTTLPGGIALPSGHRDFVRYSDPAQSFWQGHNRILEMPPGTGFDCVLFGGEGSDFIILECKAVRIPVVHPSGSAYAPTPQVTNTSIDDSLTRMLASSGEPKVEARQSVILALARAGKSIGQVRRAIQTILNSHRSGRLDDATDLLVGLGGDVVQSLASESESRHDDYSYVLIRAAGRVGERRIAERYIDSAVLALQEASVEAFADLGDNVMLQSIANDSRKSQFIRDLAQEMASE